jgi:hypothetical protein
MRAIRLAVVALAAAWLAAGSAAQAQDGSPLIAAGDKVRAKLATAPRGGAPSLTNGDAALVRAVFDAPAVRAMPLTLEIGDACVAIGTTIVAYTEYSTRTTAGDANPVAASDALLMTLQDEMALGAVSANVCVQRGFRAVAVTLAGMPVERRAGTLGALKQMRDGAVQTIEGTLNSAGQAGLKPANRSMMLASTVEDAVELAASFPAGERKQFRDKLLTHVAGATPETRGQLTALGNAFATTRCNILCETAGSQ